MSGYKSTSVDGKTVSVHRLIWEREYGPIPKGFEIHHLDFNGKNNDLSNLTLLTVSAHRFLHAQIKSMGLDGMVTPEAIEERKRAKRYRENNLEKVKKRQTDYYKKNQEARIKYSRYYKSTHIQQCRDYSKKYREEHAKERHDYYVANKDKFKDWRDAHREDARKYRQENKEHIRMMHAKYREENRPIVNALYLLNHMKKKGASPETIAIYEERVRKARELVKQQKLGRTTPGA